MHVHPAGAGLAAGLAELVDHRPVPVLRRDPHVPGPERRRAGGDGRGAGLACGLADPPAGVDELGADVGQVGRGLGARLDLVPHQLAVDRVVAFGPAHDRAGGVDDVTALGVEQEELLLDPDGTDGRSAGERGHGRLVEGGQVVGLAAGDQVAVDDDLLVLPVGAGVAQVGLQARPRGERAATDDVGLDQRPRRVADGGDGLVGVEEGLDEGDRVRRRCAARRGWRRRRAAPGRRTASASASANVSSTSKVSPLSRWLKAWTWPFSTETRTGWPPASLTASHGEVSSICSMPSFATAKAIFLPVRSVMASTLGARAADRTPLRGVGRHLPPPPDLD